MIERSRTPTADPPPSPAAPRAGVALGGGLAGYGLCRAADAGRIPALRRRPGPVPAGWGRVTPGLLRYADDQTVAGVAAVFDAVERMGSDPARFEGWGVVAAPRFLGRSVLARTLRKFDAEGVWGTSPHLIPHFALHSLSGTVGLALGAHGPNLGVGGGLHAGAEGFLAALTWLAAGVVPGAWLVLSGWSPERRLPPGGERDPDSECLALALALVADPGPGAGRPRFRLACGAEPIPGPAPIDLLRLAGDLGRAGGTVRTIATDPTGRCRVEFLPGVAEWAEDAA